MVAKGRDDTLTGDATNKKNSDLPSPIAANWVPLLRDEQDNHVPSGDSVFNDHTLLACLNHIRVLPKDYDACMKLDESKHINTLK